MSKTMPKSTRDEKYRWIKPILDKEISIHQLAKVAPFSERAIKYWLASYREMGIKGLDNKSTKPKSQPKETPIRIKEQIIELRKENKLCAQKLWHKLKKKNIKIDVRTIGKIIKAEKLVRKYRVRKLQYKYIKPTVLPGDLVEIDIKYVPSRIKGKRYFQYTAIDCATRWRYLEIYENGDNESTLRFLAKLLSIATFIPIFLPNGYDCI